jgi:DNA-binding CsgD family transcriptional regulator
VSVSMVSATFGFFASARNLYAFDAVQTTICSPFQWNPLSPREIQVLQRHAEGLDPKTIAKDLFLSYGTVRNYLAPAITKLDARNRVDAIRIATESGWLYAPQVLGPPRRQACVGEPAVLCRCSASSTMIPSGPDT